MHHRHRLSIDRDEDGAKRLVAPDHLAENTLERGHVEWPLDAKAGRDVVGEAARAQLIHEPDPLLRERHGLPARGVRVGAGVIAEPRENLGFPRGELLAQLVAEHALRRAQPQTVAIGVQAHVEAAKMGDELGDRHRAPPHRSHRTRARGRPTTTAPAKPARTGSASMVHVSTWVGSSSTASRRAGAPGARDTENRSSG